MRLRQALIVYKSTISRHANLPENLTLLRDASEHAKARRRGGLRAFHIGAYGAPGEAGEFPAGESPAPPFVCRADPVRVLAAIERGKQALESLH